MSKGNGQLRLMCISLGLSESAYRRLRKRGLSHAEARAQLLDQREHGVARTPKGDTRAQREATMQQVHQLMAMWRR